MQFGIASSFGFAPNDLEVEERETRAVSANSDQEFDDDDEYVTDALQLEPNQVRMFKASE
jgi:hypothetical protein